MGEKTSIAWTDYTFNPWIGCSKVAAGCAHCYAEEYANRYGKARWGVEGTRVKTSPDYWKQPIKWNRWAGMRGTSLTFGEAQKVYPNLPPCEGHEWDNRTTEENNAWLLANGVDHHERPRVFCASLADVFEDWGGSIHDHKGQVLHRDPNSGEYYGDTIQIGRSVVRMNDLRRDLFALIDATPNLDWLILTKRPENIRRMWPKAACPKDTNGDGDCHQCHRNPAAHSHRKNVWLLTSIATQADAGKNIPELLKCRDLAPVLGVSAEPLIEAVKIIPYIGGNSYECECGFHETENELIFYGGDQYKCAECRKLCKVGPTLDWVIGGLESGANRRDPGIEPLQALADQCVAAGVPLFCKQDAALHSGEQGRIPDSLWSLKQFPRVEVPA